MHEIIPKSPITIRPAIAGDLPFIDTLQKKHSKNVGWMQTKAIERKIELGEILIAETRDEGTEARRDEGAEDALSSPACLRASVPSSLTPVGYCMGVDRYYKREDLGIIYQMNVVPGKQRGLVGASLLKAQFERSAYGCKLYCCWCAQDIEANQFWEAMGFVPLAYRAGSEAKSRVHIFWQRRIRRGDVTTPYWFPSRTTGGSIREDRLVLPIPPGTHWSDAKPLVLPSELPVVSCQLPGKAERKARTEKPVNLAARGGMWFAPPAPPAEEKPAKAKRAKRKNDPRLIAAARELRDRWLEQVNATPLIGDGKYEVSRALAGEPVALRQLAA